MIIKLSKYKNIKIMNRSQMLKIMFKINRIIKYINNNIYIFGLLSLLYSILGRIRNNKISNIIYIMLKIILIILFVTSIGVVVYFTDLTTPLNTTYSIYYDLIEPYIELIKHLYSKLLNYINTFLPDTSMNKNELESLVKDSTSQIKNEVKLGIKEGVKEALGEIVEELENNSKPKIELYKNISFYSALIFFRYFLFVLPGPSISPDVLIEYNFINQSLIEFKITVKEFIVYYFSNPGDPGTPVTPNTPITNSKYFNVKNVVSTGTQTTIDATTVGKMVETVNILSEVVGEEGSTMITDSVNKTIKKITD